MKTRYLLMIAGACAIATGAGFALTSNAAETKPTIQGLQGQVSMLQGQIVMKDAIINKLVEQRNNATDQVALLTGQLALLNATKVQQAAPKK